MSANNSQAIVSLAGVPISGDAFGSHTWGPTLGSIAPAAVWSVSPYHLKVLQAIKPNQYGGCETIISITPPGGKETIWQRILFVKEVASPDPLIKRVLLSDVRWYFRTKHYKRLFNFRVPSPATMVVGVDGATSGFQQLTTVQSTILYAPLSLKNGNATNTAQDILADAAAFAQSNWGVPTRFLCRNMSAYTPTEAAFDAPFSNALGQVMNTAAGVDVRVAQDGALEVVDSYMGAEKNTVTAAMPYSLEGKGLLTWIDYSRLCPTVFNFLFQRLCELRVDAYEPAPGATTPASTYPGNPNPQPTAYNVIKVVDTQLTVSDPTNIGPSAPYTVAEGSYVAVDPWFAGTPSPARPLPALVAPEQALTWSRQTALLLGNGDRLRIKFARNMASANNVIWAQNTSQVQEDLRLTYQLNPQIAAQCLPGSIEALRANVVDAQTGLRQKSPAFFDYTLYPTLRGIVSETHLAWNVPCIPDATTGLGSAQAQPLTKTYGQPAESFPDNPVPLSTLKRAPCDVVMLDKTNGIFHLNLVQDRMGHVARFVPGLTFDVPVCDNFQIHQQNTTTPGASNPFAASSQWIQTHRVVVVLSAMPAGPNGRGQFDVFSIPAADALKRLGVSADAVTAAGPQMDQRVPPMDGSLASRIPWNDTFRQQILGFFNPTAPSNNPVNPGDVRLQFAGKGAVGSGPAPVNGIELQDYAASLAAIRVAQFLNHFEGTAATYYQPGVMPLGALQAVMHTVTPDGQLFTTLDCKHQTPSMVPEQFMSWFSRMSLLRALGPK